MQTETTIEYYYKMGDKWSPAIVFKSIEEWFQAKSGTLPTEWDADDNPIGYFKLDEEYYVTMITTVQLDKSVKE